jgi:hypothetical protein
MIQRPPQLPEAGPASASAEFLQEIESLVQDTSEDSDILVAELGHCTIRLMRLGALIRIPQQLNRAVQIGRLAQVYAYPAAVWQNVMAFGSSRGYQFFANPLCEGDINEGIAVDVADFSSSQAILCAAKAVWRCADAG